MVTADAGHSCSSKQFINFQSSSDIPEKCNIARPLREPTYVANTVSFVDPADIMAGSRHSCMACSYIHLYRLVLESTHFLHCVTII